jgi:hippurate hydrolase
MPIVNRVAAFAEEIAEWRHDLHAHPELDYDVHRTAGIVAEKLKAFGCDEVVTGIGRTGVVGVIRGSKPGNKVIGMRADMDALPIVEETGKAYASTTPGKMHACGHDGHTAMLLAAARHLAEHRHFDGTVYLIFQPAEEGGAGAREMIRDGLFHKFPMDAIFGELGRCFRLCSDLLQEVRSSVRAQTDDASDAAVLALYEEWLATGSRAAAERLKALGVVPLRPGSRPIAD